MAERLLTQNLLIELEKNGIDITIEEWRILFYLWKEDGINQQELAQIANKEKSTVTRQVKGLENKNLIYRSAKENDRRNKCVFLTNEGKSIKEKALSASDKVIYKAQQNVLQEELLVLQRSLNKIITNLTL